MFIFSDLFGIDLNFYYSVLHVSASSPDHMLITNKVVLATFPFPLGESESCSKTKRCTRKRFHWLSIFLKMFLKTHPLRGYIPPPFPMNHSPPTTLSPAILSLKTPPHFHHHLPLDWCTHSYPATSNRRRDSRNRTSQSSGIRLMLLKIRVTSTLGRQRRCCWPQTRTLPGYRDFLKQNFPIFLLDPFLGSSL